MNYIDQNSVVAGLASTPADWKASGAFYKARDIPGLVDFAPHDSQPYIKLLSPIPPIVSRLLPPAQLERILQYYYVYVEAIDRLYALVPTIPRLGESAFLRSSTYCLHYTSGTADYFISEYDGEDIMYGKIRFNAYPAKTESRKLSLSSLKNNQLMELDFSWVIDTKKP